MYSRRYQPELNASTLKIGNLIINARSMLVNVKGGMDPLSWEVQTGNLRTAELILEHKESQKFGIDSRDTWIALEIGSILVTLVPSLSALEPG